MTLVGRDTFTFGVVPAEAGTQCTERQGIAGELIPGGAGPCHDCASLLATGRRYQHPAWQRSAPGRRAPCWGAEIQEARLRPLPPRRQQWSLCAATALRAQGVNALSGQPGGAGKPKHRNGSQIAARGRRKAALEPPQGGSRKLDGASREARFRGPPGPARSRSWAAHEAPAYPSHLAPPPGGGAGKKRRVRQSEAIGNGE